MDHIELMALFNDPLDLLICLICSCLLDSSLQIWADTLFASQSLSVSVRYLTSSEPPIGELSVESQVL